MALQSRIQNRADILRLYLQELPHELHAPAELALTEVLNAAMHEMQSQWTDGANYSEAQRIIAAFKENAGNV